MNEEPIVELRVVQNYVATRTDDGQRIKTQDGYRLQSRRRGSDEWEDVPVVTGMIRVVPQAEFWSGLEQV